MRMGMNRIAMHRWLDNCVAGGENPERLRPVSAEPRRDDLIFWLLFDQAKSRLKIQQKKKRMRMRMGRRMNTIVIRSLFL